MKTCFPIWCAGLLENGANTCFVNRIIDEAQPIDEIIADPIARLAGLPVEPHPQILLPRELYGPARQNSRGLDLNHPPVLADLPRRAHRGIAPAMDGGADHRRRSSSRGRPNRWLDPSDRRRQVGSVVAAGPAELDRALARATSRRIILGSQAGPANGPPFWSEPPISSRTRWLS